MEFKFRFEWILKRELTLNIIKYSLNIFILLTLLSCSEENEKKTSNTAIMTLSSYNGSNQKIISEFNVPKLKTIINSKDTKDICHSNLLKNYFSELNINFDQNNFKLVMAEETKNNNFKTTSIKYKNGNCEILLPLN